MNRKLSECNFKLWLEFEEVDPKNWDKENEKKGENMVLTLGLTNF